MLARSATARTCAPLLLAAPARAAARLAPRRRAAHARAAATGGDDVGAAGLAAIGAGLVANPVVAWSLYTKATTGAGLQGDALGALEGVSYLAVLGIAGWSAYSKVTTGSGLPAGPGGALGAVEGVTFLSVLAAVAVFSAPLLGL